MEGSLPGAGQPGLVSVVLPTLNGGKYVAASVQSCLEQTHRDLELIVVDGGSTDGTLEIVRGFSDSRIKVVAQEDNAGRLPGALNVGFDQASGEYFTWTQADDYYAPDALQVLVAYLEEHAEIGLAYAGYWEIDAAGRITGESEHRPPEALYWTNPVGTCFMYRRRVAEAVGLYDVAYLMAEDVQYWMRAYRYTRLARVPGRYFYHRLHSGSLTMRGYGRYWALRVAARARRRVLGLNWFEFQRQVAAAYVEESFAAYASADLGRVRRCLARGLARNPAWLANRGVLSIGLESLIGPRLMRSIRRQA